jgi:hypothetical protein
MTVGSWCWVVPRYLTGQEPLYGDRAVTLRAGEPSSDPPRLGMGVCFYCLTMSLFTTADRLDRRRHDLSSVELR